MVKSILLSKKVFWNTSKKSLKRETSRTIRDFTASAMLTKVILRIKRNLTKKRLEGFSDKILLIKS
jgi:hypothetical protein